MHNGCLSWPTPWGLNLGSSEIKHELHQLEPRGKAHIICRLGKGTYNIHSPVAYTSFLRVVPINAFQCCSGGLRGCPINVQPLCRYCQYKLVMVVILPCGTSSLGTGSPPSVLSHSLLNSHPDQLQCSIMNWAIATETCPRKVSWIFKQIVFVPIQCEYCSKRVY